MAHLENKVVSMSGNYRNKPISKTLLTPCRTVGLSRKFKGSPLQTRTPVHRDSNTIETDAPSAAVKKLKPAKKTATDETATTLGIIKKTECTVKLSLLTVLNASETKHELESNLKKCKFEKTADNTTVLTTPPKKSLIKRLSLKKCLSSQDELHDYEDFSSTPDYKINFGNANANKDVVASKTKKRRIIELDDEESLRKADNSKIEEIRRRIKIKQTQLDELKRAAVYKKIHNVEELQQLTELWKAGRERALALLLTKLQDHGEITMSQLLKKFNIPE